MRPSLTPVLGVIVALLLAAPGCLKTAPEKVSERRSESSAETASSPPAPAPVTSGSQGIEDPKFAATVAERFGQEAANRPKDTPRAEDIYGAFEKSGMKVVEKQQHAARAFGANYCMGAKADHDVHLSVCEHADEAAAAAGRETSQKMFGTVPNRELYLRKKTTLTIRQGTKSPESEAQAKKMVDIFTKL